MSDTVTLGLFSLLEILILLSSTPAARTLPLAYLELPSPKGMESINPIIDAHERFKKALADALVPAAQLQQQKDAGWCVWPRLMQMACECGRWLALYMPLQSYEG